MKLQYLWRQIYDKLLQIEWSVRFIGNPTCYKNFDKPTCINLVLTNKRSFCHNYKNFGSDKFQVDIKTCRFYNNDINSSKKIILSVFNNYAPTKKKCIQANEAPFMTKNLRKEIIKWSKSRNKYLKSKSLTGRKNYIIQHNYCKKLLRTTKKRMFE